LDVNTPVPMADGTYKSLEHIVDGDKIIGRNGKPTLVIKAHPVQLPKRAYEIKFRSGDVVVAGGEHLWTFQTSKIKEWTDNKIINLAKFNIIDCVTKKPPKSTKIKEIKQTQKSIEMKEIEQKQKSIEANEKILNM